jgi:hypothetical protein
MKEKRITTPRKESTGLIPLFDKSNFTWILIGAGLVILGYLLMVGGRSDDPNVFNADEVYSFRRITVAPLLILAGITIKIFAIFRHPKKGSV